jgi:KDO2-lipid IV(A) lauroyltransferase
MRSLRHALEYAAFLSARWLVCQLPARAARRLGSGAGRFIGATLRFRRSVTQDNLRAAFPDLAPSEIERLATDSYGSVGITLFELLRLDRRTADDIRHDVAIDGADVLQDALRSGNGVILLSAHYGSWEMVPQALATALGVQGTVLVRGLANPFVDRTIDRLRRTFGIVTVPSTVAVRELYRTLQRGGLVFMAADQSAPPESVHVPFFGRLVPAFEGPAVLALRTGARIIFGVARRLENGTYRIAFEQVPTDDLSSEDPESVQRLTERCLSVTERAIRIEPAQWMWMHKRWKHAYVAV